MMQQDYLLPGCPGESTEAVTRPRDPGCGTDLGVHVNPEAVDTLSVLLPLLFALLRLVSTIFSVA